VRLAKRIFKYMSDLDGAIALARQARDKITRQIEVLEDILGRRPKLSVTRLRVVKEGVRQTLKE
jgi:hypothetical protein